MTTTILHIPRNRTRIESIFRCRIWIFLFTLSANSFIASVLISNSKLKYFWLVGRKNICVLPKTNPLILHPIDVNKTRVTFCVDVFALFEIYGANFSKISS